MTWDPIAATCAEPIGVDVAQGHMLSLVHPLSPHTVPLVDALGLALAGDIVAPVSIPPFRNSAMDGYAIQSADSSHGPVTLRIVGQVAAGETNNTVVQSGEAIRIMTGAQVPDGADAVVPFELVRVEGDRVAVPQGITSGANIRNPGEDIVSGTVVASAGEIVSSALVGALAAVGTAHVAVRRVPRVAILSTGDEVVPPGTPLMQGKIWDANAPMLSALVQLAGGQPHALGIAADSAEDIRSRLADARTPDLMITSGGVSAGDFDMVKDVLRADGSVAVCQVRMKPGRPLAIGTINGIPMLGLPGNPAAAYVSFLQYAWPAIRRLVGVADTTLSEIDAVLTTALTDRPGRRTFMRGELTAHEGRLAVRPVLRQGSAMIRGLVDSNCLIVIPEERDRLADGELVRVQLLPGTSLTSFPHQT
ncbi:MAG: molybdopterin molybdotransferase MoeA [Thermomicrobiales bacterium]|nr:molybdopterin molybdotransferase MoeA [Thermomicrobiales bacterium]